MQHGEKQQRALQIPWMMQQTQAVTIDTMRTARRSQNHQTGLHSPIPVSQKAIVSGEMNITKLNQRIDDIEDEIYREKLKIKKVADELGDTFDDMLAHY